MAEGKRRDEWDRCSALLATMENTHRGDGGVTDPLERNPFYVERAKQLREEAPKLKDPAVLAAMFGAKIDLDEVRRKRKERKQEG